MKAFVRLLCAFAYFLMATTTADAAIIIDFEGQTPSAGTQNAGAGVEYSEDGFNVDVTGGGYGYVDSGWAAATGWVNHSSDYFLDWSFNPNFSGGGPLTLVTFAPTTTGQVFTAVSFQGGYDSDSQPPITITASGIRADSSTVVQVFVTDALPGLQTLFLGSQFQNLVSFSLNANTFAAYDSVTFETGTAAVPEPTSILLLGTGLLGAGVRRWRQRRA